MKKSAIGEKVMKIGISIGRHKSREEIHAKWRHVCKKSKMSEDEEYVTREEDIV